MSYLDKQEFLAWAYDDLLTNTTRGVLAEYIVAKALGICDTKRVEWDKYDLVIGDIGVEVKSAAYVQTWKQTRLSEIAFNIRPAKAGTPAPTPLWPVRSEAPTCTSSVCSRVRTANMSARSTSRNGGSTCCRRVFSTETSRSRRRFDSDG